jgi:ferrous iron transport protein A
MRLGDILHIHHLLISPNWSIVENHSRLSSRAMPVQPLSETPVGRKVRLVAIDGGRELTRRLLSLGLTIGTEVEVLHHRGRAVVVGNAGNRVALGAGMADKVRAEALD